MEKIILKATPSGFAKHFIHCMEYYYWVTDTILNDSNYMYIVMEAETSPGKYDYRSGCSQYVAPYIEKITKIIPNFILTREEYKGNDIYKRMKFPRWGTIREDFILENNNKNKILFSLNIMSRKNNKSKYLNWLPFNNFSKIRHLFFDENYETFEQVKCPGCNFMAAFRETHCCNACYNTSNNHEPHCNRRVFKATEYNENNKGIKIGLVNRIKNRILLNQEEICDSIYETFKINVDIVYFEDKSFDYQINFFNKHDIIISPHGAQLCSIPFAPNDALIIECVSEEWHPYSYFPGLSYTSNKYHVMLCDMHEVFSRGQSCRYKGNLKFNITTDPQKIINIIDIYLKNSKKLNRHNCYLK